MIYKILYINYFFNKSVSVLQKVKWKFPLHWILKNVPQDLSCVAVLWY